MSTVQGLDTTIITIPSTRRKDVTRVLQLLDLMALTRRIHHSGQLITSVAQPDANLLVKYQKLIIPLVPKLVARYQQYRSSQYPMLDAFLRTLVERWLRDLLGTPSNRPDVVLKKLACDCRDCARINQFLRSDAVTETLWAAQKRRSHVEGHIKNSIQLFVTCTTITRGSPHGLQVTKRQGAFTMYKWDERVGSARSFLSLVGSPDVLARIMGDRYQDVQAALAGTKPYKISNPVPMVAPVETAPVASTSAAQAGASGTQTVPIMAGMKRKAEDDVAGDDVIDLSSD